MARLKERGILDNPQEVEDIDDNQSPRMDGAERRIGQRLR
jgi:hypothetical protein